MVVSSVDTELLRVDNELAITEIEMVFLANGAPLTYALLSKPSIEASISTSFLLRPREFAAVRASDGRLATSPLTLAIVAAISRGAARTWDPRERETMVMLRNFMMKVDVDN